MTARTQLSAAGHRVYALADDLLLVFKPAAHAEASHAHGHAQRLRVLRGRLRVDLGDSAVVLDPQSDPLLLPAGQQHETEALEATWLIAESEPG